MQNFTLGRKGKAFSIFAFILLIGNLPSMYGQCPTVTDEEQSFCYLSTVAELEATAASGTTLRWYRTATSSTPIPENELLQDGIYFAGNQSRTCTERVRLEVFVDEFEAPEAQFGNIFAPCIFPDDDIPNEDATVQDLINNTNGNNVEVFAEEFGENALAPSDPLQSGNSYFIGQRNPESNCRSIRIAIRYEPLTAPAPTGEAVQTFCPTATVADLLVEATSEFSQGFRIYATSTSFPALASNTPLVNGETYYASQIVNREGRNAPPCESTDRFEIEVDLAFESINENDPQVFCVDNETTPTIADLEARTGNSPFFADAEFTELLESSALLIDDEDYFTANGEDDNCIAERFVVDLQETLDLGDDINETICITELENIDPQNPQGSLVTLTQRFAELLLRIEGLELEDISFNNFTNSSLLELVEQFEESPTGTFSTTFTLTDGECSSSVNISLTILPATPADAGDITDQELCLSEDTINLFDFLSLDPDDRGIFTDEDGDEIVDGDFTPSTTGSFEIRYTVDSANEGTACITGSNFTDFNVTVINESEAVVEDIADFDTCTQAST
ncbi:hypothetical protein, partial [Autumnicola edwardsiae]